MGEETFVLGIGAIAARFHWKNGFYVITPMYWVSNYTYKNMSQGAIKLFSIFKSNLAYTLEYCNVIDHSIKNKLEYLELKVITPTRL